MTYFSKIWRLLATAFSFALFAFATLLLSLLLAPLIRLLPWSDLRRRHLVRRGIQRGSWLYMRVMRALGLLSFQFEGIDKLNQQGVLVVANHPTLLDALLLMSVMPNASFIVKSAMARNPVTFWIVALAGYIPNDEEGTKLVEHAAQALRAGETLMVFPEGTRSIGDKLVLKRGAANIALAAQCPLQPVVISCIPMTLRKQEPWYHIPARAPHFVVRALPLMNISDLVDDTQPRSVKARIVTAALHTRLQDELQHLQQSQVHQSQVQQSPGSH